MHFAGCCLVPVTGESVLSSGQQMQTHLPVPNGVRRLDSKEYIVGRGIVGVESFPVVQLDLRPLVLQANAEAILLPIEVDTRQVRHLLCPAGLEVHLVHRFTGGAPALPVDAGRDGMWVGGGGQTVLVPVAHQHCGAVHGSDLIEIEVGIVDGDRHRRYEAGSCLHCAQNMNGCEMNYSKCNDRIKDRIAKASLKLQVVLPAVVVLAD